MLIGNDRRPDRRNGVALVFSAAVPSHPTSLRIIRPDVRGAWTVSTFLQFTVVPGSKQIFNVDKTRLKLLLSLVLALWKEEC